MDIREQRKEILRKVQDGEISLEEGSALLAELEEQEDITTAEPEPIDYAESSTEMEVVGGPSMEDEKPSEMPKPASMGCWKSAWGLVLWLGIGLVALSAYWMYQGWRAHPNGWSFWLSWIPFLLGLVITYIGVQIEISPWLYVRVKQKPGEKPAVITIILPMPFRLVKWIMRVFGRYIPEDARRPEIFDTLEDIDEALKKGEPLHVVVDDDEDGEHVEVYIGR